MHNRCLLFLLGQLCYPGQIGNNGYANFWGEVNKCCLPFTKRFRKIRLESKLSTTFWVVPKENFREQRNLWKDMPCFFCTEFMFHFFIAIFYTSFRLSLPFFSKCSWFVQILNFGYHFPKPWIDRFAHANNKQQLTFEKRDSLGPKLGARSFQMTICINKCLTWTNRFCPLP